MKLILHRFFISFLLVMIVSSTLLISPTLANADTGYFRWPADGTITSDYGYRDYDNKFHHGLDIAKTGTVPVKAAYSGIVTRSTVSSGSYGTYITIKHIINKTKYETLYAHLRSKSVSVGDFVEIGDTIGYMGNTGNSTGQHLHFEVHQPYWNASRSYSLNPESYLGSRVGVLDGTEFNPDNGSYGYVQIDTSPEYGVNYYDAPNGKFLGRLPGQNIYGVYAERDGYYNLGGGKWVKESSVIFKRFRAYVNYDYRYGVNVYDAPNGNYVRKLSGNDVFNVYTYSDGYYGLGADAWVKSDNLIIIKPQFN
ncbi:M23 family metallopeptidase [Sediminibacillus albus]|uniref:Peptidase family M23 n=1 Tax=Sediminibacillus albus TaxID=407036 RepID=A0A1G8X821_9BACI|nr:M23 family metallopeptidase [Sediminibacillus albus]SDJ85995.1 Peptidase family M23 [Sediminibacillus albus]